MSNAEDSFQIADFRLRILGCRSWVPGMWAVSFATFAVFLARLRSAGLGDLADASALENLKSAIFNLKLS